MRIGKFHLGFLNSVENVNPILGLKEINTANAIKWRSAVRVLVVDDNDFPFAVSLNQKGFRIDYEKDISVSEAIDYDLILCDQYGVGIKLNGSAEGGSLARAIKKKYPLKLVVLYTSQSRISGFDKGIKELDDVVYSGMDDDDFEMRMDEWCRSCLDPLTQWKRFRSLLIDKGVCIGDVAQLENDFVRQLRSGGAYIPPASPPRFLESGTEMVWRSVVIPLLVQFAKCAAMKYFALGPS